MPHQVRSRRKSLPEIPLHHAGRRDGHFSVRLDPDVRAGTRIHRVRIIGILRDRDTAGCFRESVTDIYAYSLFFQAVDQLLWTWSASDQNDTKLRIQSVLIEHVVDL